MDRAHLLARLDRAWQDLVGSYATLTEAPLTEPGVTGDWSVRDIVAHVSTWEQEALTHVPQIAAGERAPRYSTTYGAIDAFNALRTEQKRTLSLAAVLAQRDEIHGEVVELVRRLPEEQIATETRCRRRLRLDTYGHYAVHARAIRAWRQRYESPK